MSRSSPACRGVRRDLRLARGLQLAPTPLITGDARSLGVRRAMEPRQRGVRRCCLTAVATPRMRWPALSHTAAVLAELPRDAAEDLLARLDRVVPSRIESFYVVGSSEHGSVAAQPKRRRYFVAIVDGDFHPAELRRLRALHVRPAGSPRYSTTRPGGGDGHWCATGSASRPAICRARRLRSRRLPAM